MMKKLFDRSLWIFLLIGAGNTLLSMLIMFLLYELAGLGYWGSSAIAFAVTSILSFILNRRFSFHHEGGVWGAAIRFALVIAVCYLTAYSLAQPAAAWLLAKFIAHNQSLVDKAALLIGQVFFTALNYFGQRFFAFKK